MRSVNELDPRDEHITDLVLDEWLTGELAPGDRARADAHFASCERCRDKRAAFEAEHAAFLAAAPRLQRPAGGPRGRWLPKLAVAGALAAAAAAMLMLRSTPGSEPPEITRVKGGPSASFFIKRGEKVTRGASGATVRRGDALRFTYTSERAVHLALLGADARSASVYFPAGATAERMAAGRDVPLDFSLELDDQLGEERIYALFCSEPVALEPLRVELDRTRSLETPAGCSGQRIVLHKAAAQ